MQNAQALRTIALSKLTAGKARGEMEVGKHEVDFLARITGSVTVGQDEDYTPTAEIPIIPTLALFIRYCGITREAAEKALIRAMTDAIDNGETGKNKRDCILATISQEQRIIDEMMTRVTAAAAKLPKRKKNGKVTSKLTAEQFDVDRLLVAL